MSVSALVLPNSLTLDDIIVQIVEGRVDGRWEIQEPVVTGRESQGKDDAGSVLFRTVLLSAKSGLHGYAIRVLPNHPAAATPFVARLSQWAVETTANIPKLVLR